MPPPADGLQAAQPSGACPPDKVHQYRLNVVVSGMPHCHTVGANRPGYLSQKSIPHLPGGFFQRKMAAGTVGFDITLFNGGWHLKLAGQLPHIPGISRRTTAQLVIKVSDMKLEIQFVSQSN
jgi:hypothetical protein